MADERLEIVVSKSGKRPNLASLRSQFVYAIQQPNLTECEQKMHARTCTCTWGDQ